MIIVCAKCKKRADVLLFDDLAKQDLIIEARCHGAREQMRLSKHDMGMDHDIFRQIEGQTGVAFRASAT